MDKNKIWAYMSGPDQRCIATHLQYANTSDMLKEFKEAVKGCMEMEENVYYNPYRKYFISYQEYDDHIHIVYSAYHPSWKFTQLDRAF